ncbi:BREX system ATP-binding protein BrxD [Bacillus cereus]|uniref:BREX system ATP-binding protein BrxD n=1 Tax=Bacillus cereus TaxID=1396 RepID=UPI001F2F1E4E|nr:BREX system ATP-binding protein BrxD [Bacillus cereus]BCB35582.1 ATP-binding protein [Bacillus cereus]BCB98391.1 ATP-binding protein [Bacillus cereus]BCC21884.1 ATP-binding protein [Bacillus cereus]BCC33495.1 ATP-binding protein [Bacillus cereus]
MSESVSSNIIKALRNGTVPAEGTEKIAVGIEKEMDQIETQINNVQGGKSDFKFVIGDYGSGKTFFSTSVRELAFDKNFVVSSVVISQEAPLHKFEVLYKKIMDGMRVKENKNVPAFTFILEEWLLSVEDKVIEINGLDPDEDREKFKEEMTSQIDRELQVIGAIAASFSSAVRSFYIAKYEGNNALAQSAVAWLKGDKVPREYKSELRVTGEITRENAFEFFRALLHMIQATGYKGLVILFDEVETVQKLLTKQMRDNAYENLRLFIDEADSNGFPNCYFLYTGTTELMESERGIKSLEPLYQRLKVDRDEQFRNLRQPVIFLDSFNKEKLFSVAKKVREIHSDVYNWDAQSKVSDTFIENLINEMTSGFGGEIAIKPRGFLRTLVDVLDKSEMYSEYLPEKKFEFNADIRRLVEDTENESAHIINF